MSFGSNLKQLRSEKGVSQEELSKKIGVHSNHLSRYERDLASPSIEVAKKLAEALDASLDQLVFGGEQSVETSISDQELISLFKGIQNLSDKQKDTVKEFLSAFVLKNNLKQQLSL